MKANEYIPSLIEKKWQEIWNKNGVFTTDEDTSKPKYYALIEFPYPSGMGLHVGHTRPYTALDIIARKRRLEGYSVLYPMGWDAFGLPTENYAIKNQIHPKIVTEMNVKRFKEQLELIGFSFDWSREINTTDPAYYKWTQWIFLKLFEKGLAYKAEIPINWCTDCKVGLANEEVVNGSCERCGGEVIRKVKSQWMLKITEYAQKLLDDLENVDYIDRVYISQKNWIGRSEGVEVDFKVTVDTNTNTNTDADADADVNSNANANANANANTDADANANTDADADFGITESNGLSGETIRVFTTRPDTMFGATYMVLSPEHPLLEKFKDYIKNNAEVSQYKEAATKKSEFERTEINKDKTGVEIKGIKAINPASGKKIPIWISDYVLITYGTGAIMAVPGHDTRDYEFAKKFAIPIVEVIKGGDVEKEPYLDIENGTMVNSGFLNGMSPQDAIVKMTEWVENKGIGKKKVNFKLRDWVFSRQRYWGEPIPLVHCEKCGWIPLEYDELPLKLPEVTNYLPSENGDSPLADMTDWVNTTCKKCGGLAKRETDIMPNWAGSSWYFLRYTDPNNDDIFAGMDKIKYWLPVDWYNGGMEHTTLHLLYSRFWHKFLYDSGYVNTPEPYARRTSHGMILGENNEKMSKSRGNVINPDDIVNLYGADTLRTYIMFIGAFDQSAAWSNEGVRGCRRFLDRVWKLQDMVVEGESYSPEFSNLIHKTIKKVSNDFEKLKFNTAIAAMMALVNEFYLAGKVTKAEFRTFLLLLNPVAPHISEELWELSGFDSMLNKATWPEWDESKTVEETVEIGVQVNGKLRGTVMVNKADDEETVKNKVIEDEVIAKNIEGRKIVRIIYIPGRIFNIVVK